MFEDERFSNSKPIVKSHDANHFMSRMCVVILENLQLNRKHSPSSYSQIFL